MLMRYLLLYLHMLSKLCGLDEFHFALRKNKVVFITDKQPDIVPQDWKAVCLHLKCACV